AHHAVLDGRGFERLVGSLAHFYRVDAPQAVQPLLSSSASMPWTEDNVDWWRRCFNGFRGFAGLPNDHLEGPKRSTAALTASATLAELAPLIDTFATQTGSTRFCVALSVVAAWLHAATREKDLAIVIAAQAGDSAQRVSVRGDTTTLPIRTLLSSVE